METKPAVKTTEFWTSLFAAGLQVINLLGVWNYVPNSVSTYALAVIGGLYAASRGLAKSGVKPGP